MPSVFSTPLRYVTATALFDGHDAAINMIRRLLVRHGAEVIHLGHNRSVAEIVQAVVQEDANGVSISSYQGGHTEFFLYLRAELNRAGRADCAIFGGGGGVILPKEAEHLHAHGVCKIYTPFDGQTLGLDGMILDMMARTKAYPLTQNIEIVHTAQYSATKNLAQQLTNIEQHFDPKQHISTLEPQRKIPILGITGVGGAGKSSLTDELIRRFQLDLSPEIKIAVLAIDPSRQKTGGALLGDRIRMNSIQTPHVFFRSLATRQRGGEINQALPALLAACQSSALNFDLIIVETAGIGQGDAALRPFCDVALYVMTPEFGAASQLEKIEMLDFADAVAINKFDRHGAADALRDVCKQWQRNHLLFTTPADELPIFGTQASRFNDYGVTSLYRNLLQQLQKICDPQAIFYQKNQLNFAHHPKSTEVAPLIPAKRQRYLSEIKETIEKYHENTAHQADVIRIYTHLKTAQNFYNTPDFNRIIETQKNKIHPENLAILDQFSATKLSYLNTSTYKKQTLSGSLVSKIALPNFKEDADLFTWLRRENLPGYFPFTAGVFPFKRENESPTRMFAGEGGPSRTNQRFKLLSAEMSAKRLSTAFDSVTLYGQNPDLRPDIYGKVGNAGVSVATLDDMKALYKGFALCDPNTSVSMTINGPAPIVLAFYLNTALSQQHHDYAILSEAEKNTIQKQTFPQVRGTVQADILKEDQGQNTCLFSTEFSLKMQGDIQEYFIQHGIRYFYSISISGYHIAEAGANPISQLAFTLANGFTFVEYFLSRGMKIDDFAPNLSFFFSNGMDAEYSVLGRVARRIWAIAMKERYGANERSQKLKYHIQTSGRSLHAQEIDFNDIRTTLQALIAIYDHCNSLHTNAYDEAITTPTDESVRRALAIQLIINQEWGLAVCENPNQGSFIIDELTDLLEQAVLHEFEKISARGGVLGAMETGYQRNKIQEESLHYEHLKHSGDLVIIGVNTFKNPYLSSNQADLLSVARSSEAEKQDQLNRLHNFHHNNRTTAQLAIEKLKQVCLNQGNIFAELMHTVQHCSLGQITQALFEVGGQYRRAM